MSALSMAVAAAVVLPAHQPGQTPASVVFRAPAAERVLVLPIRRVVGRRLLVVNGRRHRVRPYRTLRLRTRARSFRLTALRGSRVHLGRVRLHGATTVPPVPPPAAGPADVPAAVEASPESSPPGGGGESPLEPITTDRPCGVRATAQVLPVQHVVWIVFENHTRAQVIGAPSAPTLTALAARCGEATHYSDRGLHPSLPNYIDMVAGSTMGVTTNGDPSDYPLSGPELLQQLGADWRGLMDGMTSNCQQANGGSYVVRHNPAAYFTDIRTACGAQDVPLGDPPDLSARFTFIVPDLCHGMHSVCASPPDRVKQGDDWLASLLGDLIGSPQYQDGHTVIVIGFDEGDGGTDDIPAIVVSPSTVPGTRDGSLYDHHSLLVTTEDLLGLARLATVATASSMAAGFGLAP